MVGKLKERKKLTEQGKGRRFTPHEVTDLLAVLNQEFIKS